MGDETFKDKIDAIIKSGTVTYKDTDITEIKFDIQEFKPVGTIKKAFADLTFDDFRQAERYREGYYNGYSYSDLYLDPGFPPIRPPLLQEQDFDTSSHYKVYTDLGDHMALRIAEDTGQNVNTVMRSLKAARQQGMSALNVQVIGDPKYRGRAYPANVKLHPWEEFWSTFTYKPGYKFAYGYDLDFDRHKVYAQMMVEDIDRHGTFTPVACYFTLPPWKNDEEAQLYTRNHIIWGLEQHEIDEWMLFNGERVFNPHDPKNAKLQIAGS